MNDYHMYSTNAKLHKKNNLDGQPQLQAADLTKHMGITIDSTVSWKPQVENPRLKLSTSSYIVWRIKQISNAEKAKTAYHVLFESHLQIVMGLTG